MIRVKGFLQIAPSTCFFQPPIAWCFISQCTPPLRIRTGRLCNRTEARGQLREIERLTTFYPLAFDPSLILHARLRSGDRD